MQNKSGKETIDLITGDSLESSIQLTYVLQLFASFISFVGLIFSGGFILLQNSPKSFLFIVGMYALQLTISLSLLNSLQKSPKRWKAWVLFFSLFFSGTINFVISPHRVLFSFSLNIVGIILFLSTLLLIFRTHIYLISIKRTKTH